MSLRVKSLKQFRDMLMKTATTIGDNPFGRASSGAIAQPFLPDELAATFIDLVTEKNNFRKVFPVYPMNNRVRTIPKLLTGTKVYYQPSEATAGQETSWTAGSIELVAKKLFAWIEISEETFQDGVVDMRSMIRQMFINGMAEWEERAFLQGNVDHSHTSSTESICGDGYNDLWFTKDARLAFDGLLTIGHESGVNYPVAGNCTVDVFRQGLYKLGKFARQQSKLIAWVNPYSANQLLADSDIRTVDKYAQNATILTGEIGQLFNKWSIIQTDYIPEGYAVATHRDNVIIGDRRKIKMAEDTIVKNDTVVWAISERVAMEVEYDNAVLCMTGLTLGTNS